MLCFTIALLNIRLEINSFTFYILQILNLTTFIFTIKSNIFFVALHQFFVQKFIGLRTYESSYICSFYVNKNDQKVITFNDHVTFFKS